MARLTLIATSAVLLILTAVHAQWQPNVAVENRTLDEIYQAAQAEKCSQLRVAAGGDAKGYWSGTIEGFQKRFPLIDLNLTTDFSKYHDSRIDRAFYAGNEDIDIAALQTLQDFPRWKAQNRLMFYKPQNFSDLVNGEKDFDGAWLPVYLFGFGQFFYDSNKIKESEIPDNYLDLLDPKWKGKLISTYPNDDDAIAYLFSLQIAKYGFEWFERLAQQDVQWVRGSATPFILLSQGADNTSSERAITFSTTHLDGFNPAVKSTIPSKEEYFSWFQTMAIFRSTKCPESSKLFVSWILSDEWQAPLSKTITTPLNHLNALSGNEIYTNNKTQTQGFRYFENDRAVVEWWKTQYETTLGPAVGIDPNLIY
ncbi:uncharacterized protein KY384_002820 [Bacidia gigantensis]|uniref:uncharacterized protein n=1 Tax=Bacidia gigantensis TaxID=2732470 RepID=UPI001D042E11|nr:uncharacterized protein KY384_002820 [Bacidia gigantensis]KAG8532942.1 hypothetical protein KY384_002820 [Bacidia gigantensis]